MFSLLMIFTLTLFEFSFSNLLLKKISHHKITSKYQELIPKIDDNSIILLGDSRIEWGINTNYFKNKSNTFNLATPGSNGIDILKYLEINNINPKTIILGYSPLSSNYTNHDLHKTNYNYFKKIKSQLGYYLKQNYFLFDLSSVLLNFKNESLYFKSHEYDKRGNVNVEEYGNYNYRLKHQLEYYNRKKVILTKYTDYVNNIFHHIENFENTQFIILRVPIIDTLLKIEQEIIKNDYNIITSSEKKFYDLFYDFSELYPSDSIVFKDGSHLTLKYSHMFSKKIDSIIFDKIN